MITALLVLGGFVLFIVILIRDKSRAEKERADLMAAYRAALKGKDKKLALMAGRRYYSSVRGNGALTIYDEQAINNDLASMERDDQTQADIAGQLERLYELKKNGAITEQEYQIQKTRLLKL